MLSCLLLLPPPLPLWDQLTGGTSQQVGCGCQAAQVNITTNRKQRNSKMVVGSCCSLTLATKKAKSISVSSQGSTHPRTWPTRGGLHQSTLRTSRLDHQLGGWCRFTSHRCTESTPSTLTTKVVQSFFFLLLVIFGELEDTYLLLGNVGTLADTLRLEGIPSKAGTPV